MNKQAYRKRVEELRTGALRLAGILSLEIPDQLDPGSEFARMGGSVFDNPMMKATADLIDNILHYYDRLQEAMGLPDGSEPRFTRQFEDTGDPRLRELMLWVNTLSAELQRPLPDDVTGSARDGGPMTRIGKCVTEVMGTYDLIQKQLGLRFGERPKFERFLAGKCREE